MCVDTYVIERMVENRLAEARAQSAKYALLESLRPPRRGLLGAVGLTLIRVGRRIGGHHTLRRRNPRLSSPSLS